MPVISKLKYAVFFNLTAALLLSGCSSTPEQPTTTGSKQQTMAAVEKPSSDLEKQDKKPNFSGVWLINSSLSDDPRELMKKARKKNAGGNSGGMGRGGGMGGGGRGKEGSGKGAGRGKMAASNDMKPGMVSYSAILIIEHKEPVFILTGSKGVSHKIYTDFRGINVSASGGMNQQQIIAGWEENVLVVETINNVSENNSTESYHLNAKKQQLHVLSAINLSHASQPITIKRVYDLKKSEM